MTSFLIPLLALFAADLPAPERVSDAVIAYRDVEFAVNGGTPLLLDFYRPAAPGKLPCVVVIAGGGFRPQTQTRFGGTALHFAEAGYAAASISYRGSPDDPFPAAVQDAKAAVRFLRANAGPLEIDPERIGAFGQSAGGHLAAMLAVSDDPALEGDGGHAGESSAVRAAVSYAGVFDFIQRFTEVNDMENTETKRRTNGEWIGEPFSEDSAKWKLASPRFHVSRGDAPMLLVHCKDDATVHWRQSERMHETLKAVRPESQLLLFDAGGHGIRTSAPVKDVAWDATLVFFQENLGDPAPSPESGPIPRAEPLTDTVNIIRGLPFAVNDGAPLRLDLYLPAAAQGPLPAVVVIPGGGFLSQDSGRFKDEALTLAEAGFAAASIGYRGWPGESYPAAVHDAKAAVRYLRARAGLLGVDPARIGAFGQSAGGYLAGMLAVTGGNGELEGGGGNAGVSSRVQAVVCFSGLFDFVGGEGNGGEGEGGSVAKRTYNRLWLGAPLDENRDLWMQASPINHVSQDDAPILLVHSRKDSLVPWQQSTQMHETLKAVRPENKLLLLERGGHNVRGNRKTKDEAWSAAIAFFRETLSGPQREIPFEPVVAPTHANVAYGPYKRNVMDVWLADTDGPAPMLVSIHGGGFRGGNKKVSNRLLAACLESGISVAAITYRLTDEVMAPVPFHDAARAIQFIRANAQEWNVDPSRVAANGDSAGAGISLWLGLHEDLADPDNADTVLRQSTRLTCMAVENGQSSYDPRFVRALIPEMATYEHPALEFLFGIKASEIDNLPEEKSRLMDEVAAITHVSADDPPVLMVYNSAADAPVTSRSIGIHHPRFGFALKEKMDAAGVPCEVACGFEGKGGRRDEVILDFLRAHLLGESR